jgi:hypothetical protein
MSGQMGPYRFGGHLAGDHGHRDTRGPDARDRVLIGRAGATPLAASAAQQTGQTFGLQRGLTRDHPNVLNRLPEA